MESESAPSVRKQVVIAAWDPYAPLLRQAALGLPLELTVFTHRELEMDPAALGRLIEVQRKADLIVYYRSSQSFWEEAVKAAQAAGRQLVVFGNDPTYWAPTTVDHQAAVDLYSYFTDNGPENCRRALTYMLDRLLGVPMPVLPPLAIPWQGLVHPDAGGRVFADVAEYLAWYRADPAKPWVGIIATRSAWLADGFQPVEFPVVRELERQGANVLLFYSMSTRNAERGQLNIADCVERYFLEGERPRVAAVLKLTTFLIGFAGIRGDQPAGEAAGVALLRRLNVPVFQPVIATHQSLARWQAGSGIAEDIAWMVAFPEHEGAIEPIMLGSSRPDEESDYARVLVPGAAALVAARVMRRVALGRKPAAARKVVFFLNNNPCASVEANVGGASHLDTHASLANILHAMKEAGYAVEPPADGPALIKDIMDHKAISEFRWTSKEEISRCGGVLYRMPVAEYLEFFRALPAALQEEVVRTWGEPPGEAMVLDGRILITGRCYGNAAVAVQPKRGCYGARCDGQVCKILHDPHCPPTHQYLATYFYYEEKWGADAVVHVGTHGNLEFLPGKNAGVGPQCWPMVGIGRAVHLYIYNADNPPEGTIAKRRAAATLVDHMQCVMAGSGLYDDYAALDALLAQAANAELDATHAHQLRHLIIDAAAKANLSELELADQPLDEVVRRCHEALSRLRNSQMNLGMHVIGAPPVGERRTEFIASILRYDAGQGSLRDLVAALLGTDLKALYADQGAWCAPLGCANGAAIERITAKARDLVGLVLAGRDDDRLLAALQLSADAGQRAQLARYRARILELDARIDASDEIGALENALAGGFTPPGPSGLITRGCPDVLPTGRNFYSLDPRKLPTAAAWRVGCLLADKTLQKYRQDAGELPENIAFYWMCSDLLTADGEVMAQILALLGVRPVWGPDGQVTGLAVIPGEELGRPRIDVTVRTSGILRDNFLNCVDLIDAAVRTVAALEEPSGTNFVRQHTLAAVAAGADPAEATARVFSAAPGTYSSGVNLAVFASAWKTEKDLADIYVAANGYAYGGGRDGQALHGQFAADLATVRLTYNKVTTDEHDLLGCCCYFSNQGGLTAASQQLSGREVRSYYGDTREAEDINVHTLADEVRRTVRAKLLNPAWIAGEQEHGYKGAADIMKKVTRVYGWQATTRQVDDWVFDGITQKFVNDPQMREFFRQNNPYALEEIARRMLEAQQRGLWQADEQTLQELRENYVEVESWMEDLAGAGSFQGGSIDVETADQVDTWSQDLTKIMQQVHGRLQRQR